MQNPWHMQGTSRGALIMPVAIAAVAAAAVIMLWQVLRQDHENRVANVVEATSYATRSELARALNVQIQSLRTLADFWASSAEDRELPTGAQAPLELIRFEGVDAVAWGADDGTRFLVSGANPVLGYVPAAHEWTAVADVVAAARAAPAEATLGPFVDGDGHTLFHYYLPVKRGLRRGALVAVIDAHDLLAALLVDEALGYEIRVSCCDGQELYRRGAADDELPRAWARDGWIAPAPGIRWNVAHRPSEDLAADLATSAVDSVLIVGLALALLLGGLVFETRRATERATAAAAAEQRIHKLNRELEDRVLARTQKLSDVLADMDTINLSVSHDLRSPLNAISLIVGQLANGQDDVAAARYEKVTANINRITGITDRLLGYSRTSAFDSELEDVDMRALALQVVREQSIPPRVMAIGSLPSARADRVITHILLGNLVANAVNHGQSGRALQIEIGSVTGPDGVPAYFVRDNGPGLDPKIAARLFKPLTDRQPTASGDGLGLGLAIAARAVERHGGKIWVESEAGQSATFLFTLAETPATDE